MFLTSEGEDSEDDELRFGSCQQTGTDVLKLKYTPSEFTSHDRSKRFHYWHAIAIKMYRVSQKKRVRLYDKDKCHKICLWFKEMGRYRYQLVVIYYSVSHPQKVSPGTWYKPLSISWNPLGDKLFRNSVSENLVIALNDKRRYVSSSWLSKIPLGNSVKRLPLKSNTLNSSSTLKIPLGNALSLLFLNPRLTMGDCCNPFEFFYRCIKTKKELKITITPRRQYPDITAKWNFWIKCLRCPVKFLQIFFQTFRDFGIRRKLTFFALTLVSLELKNVPFGRY